MRGFKMVSSALQGHGGYQYFVGRTYTHPSEPKAHNGLHFCKELQNCFRWAHFPNPVFLDIEAIGDICNYSETAYVTDKMVVVGILGKDDVLKLSGYDFKDKAFVPSLKELKKVSNELIASFGTFSTRDGVTIREGHILNDHATIKSNSIVFCLDLRQDRQCFRHATGYKFSIDQYEFTVIDENRLICKVENSGGGKIYNYAISYERERLNTMPLPEELLDFAIIKKI